MGKFGKYLINAMWIFAFVACIAFVGSKALPFFHRTVDQTKRINARNRIKQYKQMMIFDRLTAPEQTGAVAATSAAGASEPMVTSPSSGEVIVTNDSQAWDPSAEERIAQMLIPENTKRLILENYHRTGVLPEGLLSNREPSSTVR